MERVLANKVNWLATHGYEVGVITTDQRGREPYFRMHPSVKMTDLGINYDENNGRLLKKVFSYPLKQRRHRRRLNRQLQEWKADIVVCMFNNDVSFVWKIKDGSHKVLEVHFSKNKKLQYRRKGLWALADRWRTRREEKIVSHYERFVVLTHEDKSLWDSRLSSSRSLNTSSIVIPNALSFEPSQKADLRQQRVLAIGRYDYQKGFDTLLNIWKRVTCSTVHVDGWVLDIVGDGPLRPELQKQLEGLGLQDSVRLLKPTDDIQNMYQQSSVVVMTSHYEGLPMVLIEAQSFGLPIVAFACQCGPRDIITDGVDGYLIEGRDEAAFADRLLTLMQNEGLRRQMGIAAAKASQRFTEENIMQQWENIFNETLGYEN